MIESCLNIGSLDNGEDCDLGKAHREELLGRMQRVGSGVKISLSLGGSTHVCRDYKNKTGLRSQICL